MIGNMAWAIGKKIVFNGHHSLVTPIDWKLAVQVIAGEPVFLVVSPLAGDTY